MLGSHLLSNVNLHFAIVTFLLCDQNLDKLKFKGEGIYFGSGLK